MIVQRVETIKGWGPVVLVELDGPEPVNGAKLRRADGATWIVAGIDWWAIMRRPGKGDTVGILIAWCHDLPQVGDDVTLNR